MAYQVESSSILLRRGGWRAIARPRVSRNVVLLGLVSMFTDISSEMVTAVLPVYLVLTLGFSPLQFGIVDGIYQGATALVRLAGGLVADRRRRYKDVAAVGYGVSAVCKLGLLAAGSAAGAIAGVILADRAGKGVRTAPRDALISLSSTRAGMATAFGVHRALDTAGAMLGPLVAFGLLLIAPLEFNAIFLVSFCFAAIGLAVLVLYVRDRPPRADVTGAPPRVTLRAAIALLGLRRFARLLVVAGVFGLVTISDAFLYLGLQSRMEFGIGYFPLLAVGTAAAYMLLAVPMGRLADRFGRVRVLLVGYGLMLVVQTALLVPSVSLFGLIAYLALLGAHYAATDGVLAAVGALLLPEHLRGSGLALLGTMASTGQLFGSILFGALWTAFGLRTAVLCFGAGLVLALIGAAIALMRPPAAEAAAHA
jgi:MFS family permease